MGSLLLRIQFRCMPCFSACFTRETTYMTSNFQFAPLDNIAPLKWCLGEGFVVLLFYVHGKHLRSCRDGQFT